MEENEYDFDAWTPEAEDEALRKLNEVKHIIVEGDFVGRFADGKIVKIPLAIKLTTLDEIEQNASTPIEQFRYLVRDLLGDEVADELESRSLIPVAIMAEKYFRAMKRAQELAFPES